MARPKIVAIGIGSFSFGVELLRDLFQTEELRGCRLALVDISPEALRRMTAFATVQPVPAPTRGQRTTVQPVAARRFVQCPTRMPGTSVIASSARWSCFILASRRARR